MLDPLEEGAMEKKANIGRWKKNKKKKVDFNDKGFSPLFSAAIKSTFSSFSLLPSS
ncbi:MAG: hypothetical protein ABH863_05285 [Candidatus Micrarchaeota archaeon]